MRLALVFPGCHRRGGVERLVWEAATHLARSHHVTVVAQSVEDTGPPCAEVIRVPKRGPGWAQAFTFSRAARQALGARPFDVVVSFGAEYRYADVAWVNSVHRAWLERIRSEPGSALSRYGRYASPGHLVLLACEARYFRRRTLTGVISVSDVVTDDLVRLYGVDRRLAHTVHNGYDPAQFSPARRAHLRDQARAAFGFAESDVVLLVVANELRRKGVGTVLEAVAKVGDDRLRVLLVGRTEPVDESRLAASLGVAARFHFAGPTDDVGFAHAASDLFVLPTQYEAFCLAIVEALASGLPVITSNVPGASDVVVPGQTGLIQNTPRSSDELAALLLLALDTETRRGWSESAPASVRHLEWPAVLGEAQEILEVPKPGRAPH